MSKGPAALPCAARHEGARTDPKLAPELVRKLASGRYDALAGRYLHAKHDAVDDLPARIDEVRHYVASSCRSSSSDLVRSIGRFPSPGGRPVSQ